MKMAELFATLTSPSLVAAPQPHSSASMVIDDQVMCENARSAFIVLHLKCVFHEHISCMSAAEPQRTQCDKERSGNLITMNPGVDIAVFGIHVRVHRQKTSCSNLAAAMSISQLAKSQSLSRNRVRKMFQQ